MTQPSADAAPDTNASADKTPHHIYVCCQGVNEYVAVDTNDLPRNPYDLVYLLKLETAPRSCWRDIAAAYFRAQRWDAAITVLEQATSDDVENVLRDGVDDMDTVDGALPTTAENSTSSTPCTRLDLLAALGGAYVMVAQAYAHDAERRADALEKAAHVFSRADKIDLDVPAIWAARGWAEFHASKSGAANWFDNARDKAVVLGAVGLAALHLNRSKPVEASATTKRDPVALLVSALRSDVCPPGVWTGLAYALYKEGRIGAARNVARRALAALKLSPKEEKLEAIYILVLTEMADNGEGSVENIAVLLREAFLNCGGAEDGRILSLLANMFFNGGDFERALTFARRAVEVAEGLPKLSVGSLFAGIQTGVRAEALFQLARAQHHLGMNEEAMAGFAQIKAMADSPDGHHIKMNPGVLLRLGLLKLSMGRKDDDAIAKECLEKVLKMSNDRCAIAKRALGVIIGREVILSLRKGRPRGGDAYERAVTLLTKGLEDLAETECDIPAQLVHAALVEEYYPQKALDSYRKVLKAMEGNDDKVDDEIWNNYASLLARCGETKEALRVFEEKVERRFLDDCATAVYNRARLLEMAGKVEEAEKLYRQIPKEHAHFGEAVIRTAVMLMGRGGSLDEAEKLLKEAKESSAMRPTAIAHLSTLYTMQKNYKQAQEVLEVNRAQCDYLALLFSSFMHRFLDSLDQERRSRFLVNHIGAPLVSILKRNCHNACAANGVGVYFAESKMYPEARDAFSAAGSGPLAEKVTRINLAHVQMQLGIRELKESAKITGRPSMRARSNSKSLYEQADKLYTDAVEQMGLTGEKAEFNGYCELLLYAAWAQFESGEFRRSADTLMKLVHLMPSSYVAWFNLSQALMESALSRVAKGSDRLAELELAKDEFEGSRAALHRYGVWKRQYVDPLGRVSVSSRGAYDLSAYVRQEAKSHEVKLRNAINKDEDRKEREKVKARELREYQEREREKSVQKAEEKVRKEMELRKAFEESQRRQRENEENYQRYLAAKRAEDEEEEEEEDGGGGGGDVEGGEDGGGGSGVEKKGKGKRRRREEEREEKKGRKVKRVRRGSKKAGGSDESGDEYSDGVDEDEGGEGVIGDGGSVERTESKRKRVEMGSDEGDVEDRDEDGSV